MSISQTIDSIKLVGSSDPVQQVYKMIGRLCNADCSVLLIGEKGTGKKAIARALHYFSHRTSFAFKIISAADLRESSDEELLGIDDAHQAEATIYISEWDTLSLFAHYQLVTIQGSKKYRCSHNRRSRPHNFRFVAGTDADLRDLLENGRIPNDVFYDWNFLPLYIPPLRERKEDIPAYAGHFLELLAAETRISRKELTPEAMEVLMGYDWPGNLSELKSVMRTAGANCRGNYIRADHLPSLKRQGKEETEAFTRLEMFLNSRLASYVQNSEFLAGGNLLHLLRPHIELCLFQYALKQTRGNKNKAAQVLGLHRNTLNKKLQKVTS